MNSNEVMIQEDPEEDTFWMRLPSPHQPLLGALKSLIPFVERNPDNGLGWDATLSAWHLPLYYLNDTLLLIEDMAPNWNIKFVEYLEEEDG